MYLIRDEKGEVFNKVKRPAVVFDKECGTLAKIGEYKNMKEYFDLTYNLYSAAGVQEMAEDLVLMELPKDQEIIDRVFQNTGFLKKMYDVMMKERSKL